MCNVVMMFGWVLGNGVLWEMDIGCLCWVDLYGVLVFLDCVEVLFWVVLLEKFGKLVIVLVLIVVSSLVRVLRFCGLFFGFGVFFWFWFWFLLGCCMFLG